MRPKAATASTETEGAKLLLHRATFGIRPGDLDRMLRKGTRVWLDEQLHPEAIDDSTVETELSKLENLRLSTSEVMAKYPRPDKKDRDAKPRGGRRRADAPGRVLVELSYQKLLRAVHSERQLQEIMTDFWFNHFNVYARKNRNTLLTVSSYERDAIRPNALGRFEDLLMETARHPAMLFYLDNWINTKEGFDPRDTFGGGMRQARGRRREHTRKFGINENYARELMELHTLGVDGGYGQSDVVDVARAFTGWSVVGPRIVRLRERLASGAGVARLPQTLASLPSEGSFFFNDAAHDEGRKTVLGMRIEGGGVEDGRAVISFLSRRPATARFISRKIARRFVSDDPSHALVEEMADVFLRTRGDIRRVLQAMFDSPRFLEEGRASAKVKTPLELVLSAMRATGAELRGPALVRTVSELGMPLYLCQPPTGYDETGSSWLSAGDVLTRIRFAYRFASGSVDGVRGVTPPTDFDDWAAQVLLDGEAVAGQAGDNRTERLALTLSSPAFQRH